MDTLADIVEEIYDVAVHMDEDDGDRERLINAAADLEVMRRNIDAALDLMESAIVMIGVDAMGLSYDEIMATGRPIEAVFDHARNLP